VLSKSVSDALLEVGGEEFEGTAKFCDMMDKFFDALNVSNYTECITKLKLYRRSYRKKPDFEDDRFKVGKMLDNNNRLP